mmetsp:Transcript_22771/g.53621  ORF Transcript_22771/g.53621 Transcript_22771/m.53621 type:complete len:595 (+) Transcript_22771:32-1816(+)
MESANADGISNIALLVVGLLLQGSLIWRAVASLVKSRQAIWRRIREVVDRHLEDKAVRPLSSHDLPLSARLLAEKVGKQRRKAGRVYLNALTLAMAFVVASIQLNIVRDRPRWMSAPLTWSTVALTAVASLPLLVPQVFTPGSLDVFYVAVMLIAAAVLTPPVCPLDQLQLLVLLINAVIRFPAVCLCTRVSLLVVLNCISSGVVLLRVLIEDFDTETGCSQRAPYVIMWTELVCFVVNVGMGGGLEVFLKQNVVQDLKYSRVTEELSAATALLRLTCDAVVELDEDLRLTEHSKELAAILLRDRPGSTLAGVRFADFVATSEEASRVIDFLTAEDIFNGKQEGFSAHACHTRLADSCHSKFRTEVFQVKYRKQDGQLSHLLGLRDFTDQDALTGPKAPTADVDQEDNFTKIRSCRRSQNLPATGGGVIFLELDLERQVVDAASILASSLVGMSLPELFPGAGWQAIETFANDVVEKWMAQDIGSMARKIHRFERLFMKFPPSQSESLDGTIEVLLSERSSVSTPRLLMRCVGSTVLTSASSSRSIRDRRDSSRQSGISSASHASEKSNPSKSSESRDWFGPVVPGRLGSSLLS